MIAPTRCRICAESARSSGDVTARLHCLYHSWTCGVCCWLWLWLCVMSNGLHPVRALSLWCLASAPAHESTYTASWYSSLLEQQKLRTLHAMCVHLVTFTLVCSAHTSTPRFAHGVTCTLTFDPRTYARTTKRHRTQRRRWTTPPSRSSRQSFPRRWQHSQPTQLWPRSRESTRSSTKRWCV